MEAGVKTVKTSTNQTLYASIAAGVYIGIQSLQTHSPTRFNASVIIIPRWVCAISAGKCKSRERHGGIQEGCRDYAACLGAKELRACSHSSSRVTWGGQA